MSELPKRIVTDSMIGLSLQDVDVWSDRVAVVLGQNPGPFTGPGTRIVVAVNAWIKDSAANPEL